MICPICSAQLPEETTSCPHCGTPISSHVPYVESVFVPPTFSSQKQREQSPSFPIQPVSWQSQRVPPQEKIYSSKPFWQEHKGLLYGGVMLLVLLVVGSSFFLYAVQTHHATLFASSISGQSTTPIGAGQTSIPTTPTTLTNPYPPHDGTLVINDPLQDNSAGYQWMDDSIQPNADTQGCHFASGAYHISSISLPRPYMNYCLALQTNFSDFVYQIQATIIQGDEIGVVFRQSPSHRYYYFYIRRDGSYGLSWQDGQSYLLLKSGLSAAIHTGLNQPNVLAVVAQNSTLTVYVNHQLLTSLNDPKYTIGRIGTALESDSGSASDGSFSNLMLWTL